MNLLTIKVILCKFAVLIILSLININTYFYEKKIAPFYQIPICRADGVCRHLIVGKRWRHPA